MTNRESRRTAARISPLKVRPTVRVATENELLNDENELGMWKATLVGYQTAARFFRTQLQMAFMMQSAQVDQHVMRKWFARKGISIDEFQEIKAKIRGRNLRDNLLFEDLRDALARFKVDYTNEDYGEIWDLYGDQDINPVDITKEFFRHSVGMSDLTLMHVNWLQNKQKAEKKLQKKTKKQEPKATIPETLEVKSEHEGLMEITPLVQSEPFLPGIDLYWTEKEWSIEEPDLKLLDTSSRPQAIDAVKEVTRGYASIKPISVVNAFEFYTRKAAMQKALDASLRYVPDHIKDWARVKRGKDRIALQELVDEDGQRRIVFFIEGRDQVYRGLKRL